MTIHQLAAQLYTVRDHTKTLEDFTATLRKIRAIGYESVQISAIGPIAENDIVQALAGEGLTVCATHEPGDQILNEPEPVAEHLHAIGCRYTAYPYPAGVDFSTLDSVKAFAARLNHAGKVLYDAGCVLAYHNHHIEFRRVAGQLILDVLYNETDPRYLQGEPDTYWVQNGGGDPVAWCQKLTGRLPLLHLKDYIVDSGNRPTYAEVGHGNLDWKAILPAAETASCEWYIVEQDTCPEDPFDSLRMSFEYLREHCQG